MNMDPQLAVYGADQLTELYRRIHDSLSVVPGVAAVALCNYSPQNGDSWNDGIFVAGHSAPGPNDDNSSSWDRVTPGYFDAVGSLIVKGRAISDQDTATSRHV